MPASQQVTALSLQATLPHPYTQPTSSNVPNLNPSFNTPNPSYPNAPHQPPPGSMSLPSHPIIPTYQNPINHPLVPSGLPNGSTQTSQLKAVPTTSVPNSDSSIFFRTTEGHQITNVPNDGNPKLPTKSCDETGVAITSKTQSHVLNVSPVKSNSSDDCYCFIFMNIAHLYSKTKQKVNIISDLCNLNTLFLCFCETYLKDDILDSEIQKTRFLTDKV